MTLPHDAELSTDPRTGIAVPHVQGSLGRRAAARLIDGLVLTPVVMVTSTVAALAPLGSSGIAGYVGTALLALVNAAVFLAYFSLLEARTQQTLGKRCLGLKVTTLDGRPIGLLAAATRNVWVTFGVAAVIPVVGSLLGGLATLAAVITIAIGIGSDERRGWHDRLAGATLVVSA